ncbi:MAG: PilZ domain-containing protein [Planctomycetota bacterium]
MTQSRRQYYRLRYPAGRRPAVWIEDGEYELVELSEQGARIACPDGPFEIGATLTGAVLFSDGENVPFEGNVLRRENTELVIKIEIGITPRRVVAEQRLIARQLN